MPAPVLPLSYYYSKDRAVRTVSAVQACCLCSLADTAAAECNTWDGLSQVDSSPQRLPGCCLLGTMVPAIGELFVHTVHTSVCSLYIY